MNIAKFLEVELGIRKMPYSRFAQELGVSHATVKRWMDGEDKPGVASCIKLAKWFNLDIARVIELTTQE